MAMKRKRSVSYKHTPYKNPKRASMQNKERSDYQLVRNVSLDYKVADFSSSGTINTTGGILVLHGNMTQGSNYFNNYIGRKVELIGVDLRYEIVGAVSNAILTADQNNKTRLLLFQWMDDAAPTVASVLQITGSATAVLSPITINNFENINVLHDSLVSTYTTATTTGYASSTSFSKRVYIKRKKLRPIDFNNTTGGTSKGGIFILLSSDSAVAPNPSYTLYSRLTFTDA